MNREILRGALFLALLAACGKSAPVYHAAPTVALTAPVTVAKPTDYFSWPWPDDRRLNADGTFAAGEFPLAHGSVIMQSILTTGDHLIAGFGLASPIYLPFSGPLDASTLTADSLQLIVVDPLAPTYGKRAPIIWEVIDAPSTYLPGHVIAVRPAPGFPLLPKTRYALFATNAIHDSNGKATGPDAALFAALDQSGNSPTRIFYAPFIDYAARHGLDVKEISSLTIFTTQPVLDELQGLASYLSNQPDPLPSALSLLQSDSGFDVYEGTYPAPNLQHGDPPYLFSGGDFEYADGVPTVDHVDQMRFAVAIPDGAVPANGFPLVIYSHGTGGDYTSFIGDIASDLAARGVASVGIDQVLTGPRAPQSDTSCFGYPAVDCFFNPVNVAAGRNNSRQGALDNIMLRKMLAHLTVPAALAGREIDFNLTHTGFFGHSEGGITGALYVALDPTIAGGVLSGCGGYITETVLVRTDPIDFNALATSAALLNLPAGEKLDEYHPAMALLQTLAEVSDPLNYARYWFEQPSGVAKNLYMTSGLLDTDVPPVGAAMLNVAGGVPPLSPLLAFNSLFAQAGLLEVARPVQGNVNGTTAVFRQFAKQGHFAAFDDPSAHVDWSTFLDSLVHSGVGLVPPLEE